MYNSLVRYCPSFHLYIVCLDQKLFEYITDSKFANITPIKLLDIENYNPYLLNAKNDRSYVEYIFTLSPVIALYVLEKFSQIDKITTLDADLCFFSDPTALITNNEPFSICITPHNYKKSYIKHLKYGKFNVSFQTFKNDKVGLQCLRKWESDCIDWCYDKLDGNKFADQKYLDEWPSHYKGLIEYGNGSGIAPWNILNKDISLNKDGHVYVKNKRLVYYHFHGLRNITENLYSIGLSDYRILRRNKIIKYIYSRYINSLADLNSPNKNSKILRTTHPKFGKIFYLVFLADLYLYKGGELIPIYNLNIFRKIYSYIKSIKLGYKV
jgi:hypothetical protein